MEGSSSTKLTERYLQVGGMTILQAPFPFFGGKSRVAGQVWARFGNVPNFVEPFAGSLAVLLGRPHAPGIETVNDKDCYIANFWRALKHDPDEVAEWADSPVNECDLHARHQWLVNQREFRERMMTDPDYYDVKVAGWWVWGISCWIGSGWCAGGNISRQIPNLRNAGEGVHRKRPQLSDAGIGVHRKRPHLAGSKGAIGLNENNQLIPYLQSLADRLRFVRVCCGEWDRVLGPAVTFASHGLTGVFLDPPYPEEADRAHALYVQEDLSVAHRVREWVLENGNNPLLRIALCGYEEVWDMPESWECLEWKAHGGYALQSSDNSSQGKQNRHRERVWFSPHCLKGEQGRLNL